MMLLLRSSLPEGLGLRLGVLLRARGPLRFVSCLAIGVTMGLAGCASLGGEAVEAASEPGWTRVAAGLLHRELEPGLQALRMDLRYPGLQLRLSPASEKGRSIDARPQALAALAAFNASFFDREFRPRGHTISDGQAWSDVLSSRNTPLLVCDAVQRCTIEFGPAPSVPERAHTVVGGTPWLVRDGQARTAEDDQTCARLCADRHPRTALGLTADGRWLIVLMVEGRREGRPGLSLQAVSQHLIELGARQGLNLDGGGSSALFLKGVSVMQRPANEPAQRAVSNVLMIVPRTAAATR